MGENGNIDRRTTYATRKQEQLERGHSFFPNTVIKDIVVAAVILIVLMVLAATQRAPLDLEANPTGSAKPPRPEWYFLFLFEALKFLPGNLEWLGAILLPGIALVVLFLLPLIDRSPYRNPLNRPLATGVASLAILAVIGLTVAAATAPEPAAVGAPQLNAGLTPLEQAGQRVYQTRSCPVCHKINSVGGNIGPDLTTVGLRLDASWLVAHLQRPAEIAPGTRMPQITLASDELMSLTAYLLALKQPETRTPAQIGAALFAVYCNSCHPSGQAGIGPKVTGIPVDRVAQKIRSGGGGMPTFNASELSDEQLAAVVAYIATMH
ncbi:MAG: c-type cytochrome [Chloroflexota bacterium]